MESVGFGFEFFFVVDRILSNEMPRKPKGHRRSFKPRPLTFSRFARSVAQVASVQMVRGQTHKARSHRESLPNSTSNGFLKKSLMEKHDQSESSEDEGFEGVVQADFVFFDPKLDDFHGVKVLLQTYLDDTQWDLSGFVDLILAQTTVGTVVKIEDDDDNSPFSVVTALNLGRYKASYFHFFLFPFSS
ncbi:hypothetical protein Patl1_15468 [Pistacia atlantica]|uniref:Uncharacterized protein n=1 Tax=Pistacia atlantica TaxID=434234 RepID=A0ACC1B6S0_9ROSI|nr:hypothetical protein Patl1_15468 [Pistacia atlantica]